jgi:hypothetical protein
VKLGVLTQNAALAGVAVIMGATAEQDQSDASRAPCLSYPRAVATLGHIPAYASGDASFVLTTKSRNEEASP